MRTMLQDKDDQPEGGSAGPQCPEATVPKGSASFAGGVLTLSGGSIIAQAVGLLAAPIVARLFEPEAFGLAAAFGSLVALLSMFGCLTYHLAIVIPKRDEDAGNLLGLCWLLTVATTGLVALVTGLFGTAALDLIGVPQLEPVKWLIPIAFFLTAGASAMTYWGTRHRQFSRLAMVRVETAVAIAGGRLGAGFLGFTTGVHLTIVRVFALLVSPGVLGWYFLRRDRAFFVKNCSLTGIWAMAKRYKKFPLITVWAGLVSEGANHVPIILLMIFFGADVTGLYAFAIGLLHLPAVAISQAIAGVLFQRAGAMNVNGADLAPLFEGVCKRLITLGLLPCVIVTLSGAEIFGAFFGQEWTVAGVYASVLAFGVFGTFVGGPLGRLLVVYERQGTILSLNLVRLLAMAAALVLGGFALRDSVLALLLFSLVKFVFGACSLIISARLTHASGSVIFRHFLRQLSYVSPSAAIVACANWGLHLSTWYVLLVATVSLVPYVALVLRNDDELRAIAMRVARKLVAFGR